MKAQPVSNTTFEFIQLRKAHYFSLLLGAGLFATNFYSGIKCTKIREETFGRNHAIIEAKYGKLHREAFGEDAKISKLGYPDMGSNLYADLLPYKDWIKLNNSQRCH